MKLLLLTAVIIIVVRKEVSPSLVEEDKVSGKVHTLYLAADDLNLIAENGPLRIYIHNILSYNNYKELNITFYLRQNNGCQIYAVSLQKLFSFTFIKMRDHKSSWNRSHGGSPYITGLWIVRTTLSTLPESWVQTYENGIKVPGVVIFALHFISNTTLIMHVNFSEKNGNIRNVCAAFSKEISLSKEIWDLYVDFTASYGIPIKNIQDILKTDTCPQ
ncbi:aphrodisin-like [Mesocricetus auratus]|uniref:Aphrodisin-like n=1 Tax=Mesocricetus auratus TaxID=10036 RepID=A0ABM2X907_MESAU|nr:aphrodisin-like [Mesocricetus auratus]